MRRPSWLGRAARNRSTDASRRRRPVDGVEDGVAIQHERAVEFHAGPSWPAARPRLEAAPDAVRRAEGTQKACPSRSTSNSKRMALKTVDLLDEAMVLWTRLGEEFEGSGGCAAYRATLYGRSCHAFSRVRRHELAEAGLRARRSNRTRVSKPTRRERLLSSGTTRTTTRFVIGGPPSTRPAANERMPSDCVDRRRRGALSIAKAADGLPEARGPVGEEEGPRARFGPACERK